MKPLYVFLVLATVVFISSAQVNHTKFSGAKGEIKLITLDPGHYHAALVQKTMYNQVDPNVYVYAPESQDVKNQLNYINNYNSRKENPTQWNEVVYTSNDYLEKMLKERKGNVVVISGKNLKKTEYIYAAVNAGMNVLADKPMAMDQKNFELLKKSFDIAKQNGVLLYDIMVQRSDICNILQQQLSLVPEIFGTLEKGTIENPAIIRKSTHSYYKIISGSALKRPAWFFDVTQQGEGIVDITTHLVDLVQWQCFPNQIINYTKDIRVLSAKHWGTKLTQEEFNTVTQSTEYPDYLKKDLQGNNLNVFSNAEINYTIKGVHAQVYIVWNYRAPEDAGDAIYSIMRGTKANLVIRQGKEQKYKPILYIEPVSGTSISLFEKSVNEYFPRITDKFESVSLKKLESSWEVVIPEKHNVDFESQFADVTKRFLQYLVDGKLPNWETPNMLAKYYTTTKALELAKRKK